MNLCVNARDAMTGGGRACPSPPKWPSSGRLTRRHPPVKPGAYVKLSISDSGSGMNKDVLARIFDPFFTTKAKGQGSGLGLSVVYGIVKGHEGFVTGQTATRSRAAVFNVFFPVSGKPEILENDPTNAARPR